MGRLRRVSRGQNACKFKALVGTAAAGGTAEESAVTAGFGGAAEFDQQKAVL